MNVTAVLPEVVQQRGKEELLEHCTPTGDDQKSDKGNRNNFSEVFRRCGELEMGRFSGQKPLESRKFSDFGKPPVQMDSLKKTTGEQTRAPSSPEAFGEVSKAGFSPLSGKLGFSLGGKNSVAVENKNTSPFRSTLLDTSTLTEDLKNMDWSSSEEDEECELGETRAGRRSLETKRSVESGRESPADKADTYDTWTYSYKGDRLTKRNIVQSSSYPLFAVRPYHLETKDLSTKELEDTIRHSLSEANKQTVSPTGTEREACSIVNQAKTPNQILEASESPECVPGYALQRSASSTFPYYSNNNNVPPAPWMTRWKTRMCKFYPMGMCKNGAKCSFAHSAEELREPESFAQSHTGNTALQASVNFPFYDMESSYLRAQKLDLYGSESHDVSSAPFHSRTVGPSVPESVVSHSFQGNSMEDNLSSLTSLNANNQGKSVPPAPWMTHFKTKMCKFFSAGECKNGDKCSFAHSMEELREPPPPEVNEERRRRYLRRQLQQIGIFNERNNRVLSFNGNQENPSSQTMRGDPFAKVDYLRVREHVPSSTYYDMYYRDVPKLIHHHGQTSGMSHSPKKNLMYSLSSPQLGGSLDISSNIHRSSSYSFLELNSDLFNNDLTNYPAAQSSLQYYGGDSRNVIHSAVANPDPSYIGGYNDRIGLDTNSTSSSNIRNGSASLSKALSSSKVSDSLHSLGIRKGISRDEITADPGSSSVSNTPRAVQQEEIWDEIDRDILHIVFDEDMESKNN